MTEHRPLLGEAGEDCLKAIYKLQANQGRAATSALAVRLGIADPTVTAMVKRLARLGLVSHTPYRGVELTPAGERIALEIIRHHRLVELYLAEALGLSWDKVDAEAERLEHHVSDELEDRMDAVLGHPTVDPHGDPIPTKDGRMDRTTYDRLVDLPPGDAATIRRVPDGDPSLLQYLAELGLVPGARVEVIEKSPFDGPLTLRVGRRRHSIGRQLAETVLVEG
jgi:DtxR family Mn-dependent transcriptional regulator